MSDPRESHERLPWDEYFMKIAFLVAERSTCRRHHVGAVVVRNKRILTTGYNGAASGVKDCLELGCLRDERGITSGEKHEVCRAIHAEQNAVIQAGLHGISIQGATLYCTHTPCILCAKILVNARIDKIIACGTYPDEDALRLLREAGVQFELLEKPSLKISALA
ncbi:MAG: cytidine deaminase [Latescibacteria bacterium DG_63]|nr:MAG: cytidine deaminase [Latescibacteria bacterium DG_63]